MSWCDCGNLKSIVSMESNAYLSPPWRPAALFDLPNYGGHQEQGQEAAVGGKDRGRDESKIYLKKK